MSALHPKSFISGTDKSATDDNLSSILLKEADIPLCILPVFRVAYRLKNLEL